MSETPKRTSIADDDLIAERQLEYRTRTGDLGSFRVRIAKPVAHEPDGMWTCGLHLDGLEGRVMELWGVDSMQALIIALRLVPAELERLKNSGMMVTFDGNTDTMFPDFSMADQSG